MTADMPDLKRILGRLAAGERLDSRDAEQAFDVIMSGNATPAQVGAFLMALRVRGETVEEIAAAARVLRARAARIDAPPGAVDTCGTGGDGAHTLNVSTAVSFVLAACGVPVAKHGNRAASSKSGAADVLAALGVNLDAEMDAVQAALDEIGLCFLMAPRHHSAMRHVAGPRAELGTRTIFNLLGPLLNPAGAKRQLLGVFDRRWLRPIADVLGRLGSERAWVVHGEDGLDEITTAGATFVAELKGGAVREFTVTPDDAGLPRARAEDLKGGEPAYNAERLLTLLRGARDPYRDIVLLNAAAALIVAGRVEDLRAGVALAAEAIDGGAAERKLQRLVEITHRPKRSPEEMSA